RRAPAAARAGARPAPRAGPRTPPPAGAGGGGPPLPGEPSHRRRDIGDPHPEQRLADEERVVGDVLLHPRQRVGVVVAGDREVRPQRPDAARVDYRDRVAAAFERLQVLFLLLPPAGLIPGHAPPAPPGRGAAP